MRLPSLGTDKQDDPARLAACQATRLRPVLSPQPRIGLTALIGGTIPGA
jgi:hypothetical protein